MAGEQSDPAAKLEALRKRIDALDAEIVRVVNERARCAREIGELKRAQGAPVFVPAREKAVYERVLALNQGPLPAEAFRAIYREIMSASLALERCPRVAYLGPPGTFSHKAARCKFGSSVEYHPATSFRDVSWRSPAATPTTGWCPSRTPPRAGSPRPLTASSRPA